MDMNSRENFLETAESRDSVFKLARMLGYTPRRNVPASGLAKIVSIQTNEGVTDSLGNGLGGKRIFWDDANNPDSYEQFITVLNASLSNTNRFTSPSKSGTVNNIKTEIYRIVKQISANPSYPFSVTAGGSARNFEVIDADFIDGSFFYERHPDPVNSFGLIYRNDGLGISSQNSGFFVMFKQGSLESQTFNFTAPIPSRTQDITVNNINQTDFWLQEVRPSGSVISKWTQIPNTVGQTVNFNAQQTNTRNLYAVESLFGDQIRLKFTFF